ncbi:DUF1501 domain-containing protein [Akkermansiaceae bacterium]|nr:DUF1501 domain-containing protein [Akkermansiaceae bacterium]MDA7935848.1 DUF1501 domain-containing protein [bacterium]MDB4498850.1 DUF1501 domain-containing protein [Akkermansiaceae bacterium]
MKNQSSLGSRRSRRQFLGEASCSAVGTSSLLSTLLTLKLTSSLSAAGSAPDGDYRALVCVFLAGGNDSFNMLVPVDDAGYEDYASSREGVALPVSDFTPFPDPIPAPDGRTLGFHSGMTDLHQLFVEGKAAAVANVGTLVEPTTLAGIDAGSVDLPLGLFSHADQQKHWHSGLPQTRSALTGWGGRMADLLTDLNVVSDVSMNVSIAGNNIFQTGATTVPLTRTASFIPRLTSFQFGSFLNRRTAIESMMEAEYRHAFEGYIASSKEDAIAVTDELRLALSESPGVISTFDQNNVLSRQLKAVAETISARDCLGKRRQTFFVEVGGWDHHSSLDNHPAMLAQLSAAIGEFQVAMGELGLEDKVTLFTASDFGRTLSPNGTGTDHAWGGNQIVVGGAVDGGQVFGTYPELTLASSLDTGRGRLIPTTSVDEYFADLALWMGVSATDLPSVLPNLSRFHDVAIDGPPLGLMKP